MQIEVSKREFMYMDLMSEEMFKLKLFICDSSTWKKKKLGEMWSKQSAKDKQPYKQKAEKKRNMKRISPHTMSRAKVKQEKGPGRPTGSIKKNEPEDEEEKEAKDGE